MSNNFGVTIDNKITVFTFVFFGENPGVNLYSRKSGKIIKKVSAKKTDIKGNVCSIKVNDIDITDTLYLLFYGDKEYVDPYAKSVYKTDDRVFCRIVKSQSILEKDVDLSKLILYKLHMRGFTMAKKIKDSSKGNYKGIISSLPYFKKLGINGLLFFPLYEFNEDLGDKKDFWGYSGNDMFPMAPKASYFGENPYENAVSFFETLSNNGITSIIEFCFNKNNNLNEDLIISALRFWAFNIGVDGFRFLGDDVPTSKISQDPYLSRKILIFDGEPYVSFGNPNLCFFNDDYVYSIRRMQNHMEINAPTICGMQRRQGSDFTYINYVSKANGFTLLDSFSYRDKHNEDNGESNIDGNNYNFSDNCGVEGDTRDKTIVNTRLSRIRSSLLLLLLSQSVPLINAGDESLNTSLGNNNPYCQDNQIGWLNYSKKKDVLSLQEYVKQIISFRKSHSVIENPLPFKMNDYKKVGIPDISYHSKEPWAAYLDESKKAVGILLSGEYASPVHEDVMILINYHNSKEQFTLPVLSGKKWYFITNSLDFIFEEKGKKINTKGVVTVPGDSVTLLVAR